MPNKAEKNDAIRPLSDDEETFGFDRLLFAPSGAQGVRIYQKKTEIGHKTGLKEWKKILIDWIYICKWFCYSWSHAMKRL